MLCSHFLCKAYKRVLCDIRYKMAGCSFKCTVKKYTDLCKQLINTLMNNQN